MKQVFGGKISFLVTNVFWWNKFYGENRFFDEKSTFEKKGFCETSFVVKKVWWWTKFASSYMVLHTLAHHWILQHYMWVSVNESKKIATPIFFLMSPFTNLRGGNSRNQCNFKFGCKPIIFTTNLTEVAFCYPVTLLSQRKLHREICVL